MVLKFIKDSYILYLGENAQENWDLLSKDKKFLMVSYLDSFPSSHCIIEYVSDRGGEYKYDKKNNHVRSTVNQKSFKI